VGRPSSSALSGNHEEAAAGSGEKASARCWLLEEAAKDWSIFLQVSLAAASNKLAPLDHRTRNASTVNLCVPSFPGDR
jgi:hypothetical protein